MNSSKAGDFLIEEWRPVVGSEEWYEVSNTGKVRSYKDRYGFGKTGRLKEPRILKQQTNKDGYKYVTIPINGKSKKCFIQILVAKAFIPNPENKPEVNHEDGDKNNNTVENLFWSTRAENMAHARRTGLWDMEGSLRKAREAWIVPIYCYEKDCIYESGDEAAKDIGVSKSMITLTCQGKNYNVKGLHICYLSDKDWLIRNIDKIKAIEGGKKQIKAINIITGEELIFNSRKEASRALGIPDSYISNIIAGRANQTRNWTFKDLPIILEERRGTMEYLNSFPGYEYKFVEGSDRKQNMYMGTNLGFGGYVYFEEGIYTNVALLDIASLHPHSIIALNKFGKYTKRYEEIKNARIAIKHHDFETARTMLDGKLAKYLTNEEDADKLAQAMKLILNSTYGFCSATFENPFLDSRDTNNTVALRGSLFMRTLQEEVTKRGFTVAHIKTDSIKIPNATPEIIQFCMEFAKKYGYEFEHEATYEKMCLVNGSTYIAKYATAEHCEKLYGYIPGDNKKKSGKWTATAAQFQVPYVFKTLFSKEPITFDDLCETKSVQKGAIYLDTNEHLPDVFEYEKELAKMEDKYKKGQLSDRTFESTCEELNKKIEEGHEYHFIGKVGRFCPIKPGYGGGLLVTERNDKYNAVNGSKGYRWMEAEMVKTLGKEEIIDHSYYIELVDEAVEAISKYGDFEQFISDDPFILPEVKAPVPDFMNIPEDAPEELPFD